MGTTTETIEVPVIYGAVKGTTCRVAPYPGLSAGATRARVRRGTLALHDGARGVRWIRRSSTARIEWANGPMAVEA